MSLQHEACSIGNMEIVRLLLAAGAKVNMAALSGETPLHDAVRLENGELIKVGACSGSPLYALEGTAQYCMALASYGARGRSEKRKSKTRVSAGYCD